MQKKVNKMKKVMGKKQADKTHVHTHIDFVQTVSTHETQQTTHIVCLSG